MNRLPRRDAIKSLAGLGGTAFLAPGRLAKGDQRPTNLIQEENARHGTREWMLDAPRIDPQTKYRCPWIEGYCSHASIAAGETLQIFVSTNPAARFTIDVYRLGYYGGDGGRLVKSLGSFAGETQVDPPVGAKRVRDCGWRASAELEIPSDWLSGVYLGKLTTEGSSAGERVQSYVVFIVRDDRRADFLFQCSDNTWHAYNRWPSQYSLYDDGKEKWYWGGKVQVSYNRPYGKYCQIFDAPLSTGSGEFLLWEFPFAFWMEQHGYDLTYLSNIDTHRNAAGLTRGKAFLSIGHDEYWTNEMYENVRQAIAAGVHVGFFSGNAVYGRILFDEQCRAFERVGVFGPPDGTKEFAAINSLRRERPYGNELMGAHSTGPVTGGADWICTQPDHWIYAGTGMQQGDRVPGLIGWEWHGDPAAIPGLEIVASGPTQRAPNQLNGGTYTATVYPGPKGNIVFNASTIWWADGLSQPPGYVRPKVYTEPKGPDPRVQQMTRNILDRMKR